MGALTADRDTREIAARVPNITHDKKVKTKGSLFLGAIGAIDADNLAVPASDTAGLIVLGRVERVYEDRNGDERAVIRSGLYEYDNGAAAEALDATDSNHLVFIVDDHTLGAVGGTNHIKGGVLRVIDENGKLGFEIGNIRLS